MSTEGTRPGLVANTLAIAGFVVVVIVIIWGLVHLSTLASPWLSSLFSLSGKSTPASLHVSAPTNAISGDPFTLNWSYANAAKGSYALIYPCNDNLSFKTSGSGSAPHNVPCGTAFSLTGNAATLIPTLSGTTSVSVPLTVVFTPGIGSSAAQAQGSATVLIKSGTKTIAETTPAKTTARSTTATHTVSEPADLSVRTLSASTDPYGNATFVFDIGNVGGSDSGTYDFIAYLPTQSGYTYYSPEQESLAPGAHITNTLTFTQAIPGSASVVVNTTNDADQTDNYAATTLSMPTGDAYYASQPQYYTVPAYYLNQPTYYTY